MREEGGWRGFAAPQLEWRFSPVLAWPGACGIGRETSPQWFSSALARPSFLIGTIAVSAIAAWAMMSSGGSEWPAILAHGVSNDACGLAGDVTIIEALTPGHQLTRGLPMLLATGLVLALDRKRMFSRAKPEWGLAGSYLDIVINLAHNKYYEKELM